MSKRAYSETFESRLWVTALALNRETMGQIINIWEDTDTPGLIINYQKNLVDVIKGARDTVNCNPMGPPIEPDEEIYTYTVAKVILYDVVINLTKLDVDGAYGALDELTDDVCQQIDRILKHTIGYL